jgi:glycosidase
MSRIFTQLGEDIDLWRMAIVYYMTMRGIPQFYYGTEILMSHPGTDSHGAIRSDFPGGWDGDTSNAFTGLGLDGDRAAAQSFMRKLLHWRKSADVIHHGKLMQFAPIGNVYTYFRYDDDDTVMVVFNLADKPQTLEMSRFAERIGQRESAVDIVSGQRLDIGAELLLGPRSFLLLQLVD